VLAIGLGSAIVVVLALSLRDMVFGQGRALPAHVTTSPGLPGAQSWGGAWSYVFGTNDTIEYAWPNVDSLTSVQQDLHQGGLTLMREWFFDDMSDDEITTRAQTVAAAGMTCLGMLGSTSNVTFLEHVVSMLGDQCNLYEFGNEPDQNGYSTASYLQDWNTAIPQLRRLNPHALFGGPADASPYSDWMLDGFLLGAKQAGVLPDFITYHDYTCWGKASKAACIKATPQDLRDAWTHVLGVEEADLGGLLPTGVTEYNFDPGSGNLYAWGGDNHFLYQWTKVALKTFISLHVSFADQFTTLNWSGYGKLDMFQDASPYNPKGTFWAIVQAVTSHGGPATLSVPAAYRHIR